MGKKAFLIILPCLLVVVLVGVIVIRNKVTQAVPNPQAQPKLSSTEAWIQQYDIPLKTTDPTKPLDDLEPLQKLIGNSSIVGLGEASHGAHEIFTMKHRLLEFLVEKMGFTMFAMEGSWTAGEQINAYVLNGQGNAEDVLQQFQFWTWDTQEVLDLLQWMRLYNANPAHVQKVQFAGFDCQAIDTLAYDRVIQYIQRIDPPTASKVIALYRGLRPDPTKSYNANYQQYNSQSQSTKDQYAINAVQVYDLLKQHEKEYSSRSSEQIFTEILQEARVIVQGAQFMGYNLTSGRDQFMAENIGWLHERADGGKKMVLWAHDEHIMTFSQNGYTTMGAYLSQQYQSQYLAIGTSFSQGSFNSIGSDGQGNYTSIQSFPVPLLEQDSYNSTFGRVGLPLYALDLRHPPDNEASQWLNGPHDFLTTGAVYAGPNDPYLYESLSLPQCFDIIIEIYMVTASKLLPFAN